MGDRVIDALLTDCRFALRILRKNPGFSAAALATLALGIGATTAMFSAVDHVLLRPLAYDRPDRLYAVHEGRIPVNGTHFEYWRRHAQSFEHMALIGRVTHNLTGSGDPELLSGARVSPALFPMLGIPPLVGRTFIEEEDQSGHDAVVLLDHDLWQGRFAADPNVVGRRILLDGRSYEVVGVLPADFRFPKLSDLFRLTVSAERPQFWKPFALGQDERAPLGDFNFACIVSLRPGVSPSSAFGELRSLQALLSAQLPQKFELESALVPLQDQITGRSRTGLEVLLAAVGIVLLIGCVNLANLLLTRASGRRREIAIRAAIGASRARLARQMLVESLLLSSIGGALGAALAYGAVRVLARSAPVNLPRLDEIHVDIRVLLFTMAISLAAGLLFGILPAWRVSRTDPQDAVKATTRTATPGARSARVRSVLVAVEVGLSAACLVAGGLLLHSLVKLMNVDAGFDARRVVTVGLNLPTTRYLEPQARATFMRRVLEGVQALPGVSAAGVSNMLPLGGEGGNNSVTPEGAAPSGTLPPVADIRLVNTDYFRTMGIPVERGRLFDETDGDHPVVLVSALTARRLWPEQDPIGRRLQLGNSSLMRVTGVVGDIRGVSLTREPSLTVYVPYWQRSRNRLSLVVRTDVEGVAIASGVRGVIRRIDPELPVPAVRTMEELVALSVAQQRFQTTLVLLFGMAAALLASIGIYGVISYSVTQRTSELGIRMALGAHPGSIRAMVMRQGLVPVLAGLAGGLGVSMIAGRLMSDLLFGVRAIDPPTMAAVVVVLAGVAGVAGYVPARRATRIDPVTALRQE
jgi:putative ABC transport system permease protein